MIHSFTISNFFSFWETAEMNFLLKKSDPIDDTSVVMSSGARVSKLMTIVGPNASGKSNLLKAIMHLKFFLVDTWELPPDNALGGLFRPFLLTDKPAEKTKLSCEFETQKNLYKIEVVFHNGIVESEIISHKTSSTKRVTWKKLHWRDEGNSYRTNASLLFTLEREGKSPHAKIILDFWRSVFSHFTLKFDILHRFLGWVSMGPLIQYYKNAPHKLTRLNDMLRTFEFWFDRVMIKEVGDEQFQFQARHSKNGKEYDLVSLSDGTVAIINNAPLIFDTLDSGGVLVFDELDSSLHPEVVDAIVDMFASKRTNPKNAQIIFSTHSPRILNRLHKHQIQLVEKDEEGSSQTWRLDEMEGVTSRDNYYAKYMAGTYGAFPNIAV